MWCQLCVGYYDTGLSDLYSKWNVDLPPSGVAPVQASSLHSEVDILSERLKNMDKVYFEGDFWLISPCMQF